jgi:hypothetical protein
LLLKRDGDVRTRFLLSQFVPLYGLFLFFSLNSAGHANWTVPALVTGIIFTVVYWRELVARRPAWRWGVRIAFGLALIMTIALHDMELLHLPRRLNPLYRAQGWPDFAAHVQQLRIQHRANLLLAAHYSFASLMAFYLPDQPTTYQRPEVYGSSQFTLWPTYQVTPETRALYVISEKEEPPDTLKAQFKRIELVDDFWSQHHGQPMNHFSVYLCTPE